MDFLHPATELDRMFFYVENFKCQIDAMYSRCAGVPSRPVSVAPTASITTQQQPTVAPQQPSMTSQHLSGQVPIVQSQTQQQTLGQIGPQSSISQNTSVPLLTQTMSTSQMHQAPVQVTQSSHLPAQSLPHGAHAQMTGSGSITNTPTGGAAPPQQQQHAAQSLGHNMLQQNKPAFMNQPQHQQSQPQNQTQFQQQPNSQQQQMMSQQSVITGQQGSVPQNAGQVSQTTPNQPTQQQQNYQTGVMLQNIQGLQQQVHVQQMNTAPVNQHSVQMQQTQPNAQGRNNTNT